MNNERLDNLKNELFYTTPVLSSERARLITESYKLSRSLPQVLRRAKALEYILDNRTIFVRPGELLVGAVSSESRGGEIYPEYNLDLEAELDDIERRSLDRYTVSDEVKAELREVFRYWRENEVTQADYQQTLLRAVMPQEVFERGILTDERCRKVEGEGHLVPNFDRVMKGSLTDVIAFVSDRKDEMTSSLVSRPENAEKILFLDSVKIVCAAAIKYSARYATLLKSLVPGERDPVRKKELEEMAEICEQLYTKPVETFREAIQYIALTIAILNIECNGVSIAPGRVDQYLYPYYKRDIESGKMTRDEAVELCASLLINGNSYCIIRPWNRQRWQTGYKGGLGNPTLGGQKPDGSDACNELTGVWLDAVSLWGGWTPIVNFRIHENIDRGILLHCCKTMIKHGSQPNFIGDNAGIRTHLEAGASLRQARDFAMYGCSESVIPGKATGVGIGIWPIPGICKWFEIALNDGVDPATGKRIGPHCGDLTTFTSIEEVRAAFKKQVEYFASITATASNLALPVRAKINPTPFLSVFIDHRLEICRDVTAGGPPNFNHSQALQGHGVIDIADSMAVLDKLVFREKKITAGELKRAMENNFDDEILRRRLVYDAPKFGNDDEMVDSHAAWVWETFFDEFQQYTNAKGGRFHPTCQTMSANVPSGEQVGALPNGRRAGEPLVDNTSPGPGLDVNGITSVIKSVTKVHSTRNSSCGAGLVNVKFHPGTLANRENLNRFADLALTFNDLGGWQLQFNIVSPETLKLAQKKPDEHRNLVVKVAGYNAQFIMLDKRLQDQIISRTEYAPANF
jgi:formate C-acetyltransferase